MEVAEEAGQAVLAYALAALGDAGAGPGEAAAALAALCDVLALAGPDLVLAIPAAPLAARLPALLAGSAAAAGGGGGDGDVPMLAARAMAEACEAAPDWAPRFAQHGAVQALSDRLLAVDSIELAEECLRALDAISLECPDECLTRGVAAAVLQFFDFFSTSKQKVALRIVSNIFNGYDEEDAPTAMEAVPALCNLLQSSEKTATMTLMGNEGWKSLNDDTLTGILGLLKNLASVSEKAVKSLFELNFCELLKQMITYYSSSHHDNDKVQMLVELIYQLMLPPETSDQHAKPVTANKNAIMGQSTYRDQLASIVALIAQIAKFAAQSSVCYSCVVVIGSIVELSTPNFLMELQKTVNISSFLTCLLARKNRHILFQTLKISRTLLEKDQQFFFETFTKEGVKRAIDAISSHNKNSMLRSKRKNSVKERCFCFDLESSLTDKACRVENNVVMELAEEINKSFFLVKGSKKSAHKFGFSLRSVRDFFARSLTSSAENQDKCKQLSYLPRRLLSDELQVCSIFEFVESGSIRYLTACLSNGEYCNANPEVQSRLQKFAHLALTMSSDSSTNPLEILVGKLLDTLDMCYDTFPVMLSDEQCTRESTMIPLRYPETREPTSLELKFRGSRKDKELFNYTDVLSVNLVSTPQDIEPVIFRKIFIDQETAYKNSNQVTEANRIMKLDERNGLRFFYNGMILNPSTTFLESILLLMNKGEADILIDPSFWDDEHNITYRMRNKSNDLSFKSSYNTHLGKLPDDLDGSDLLDVLKVLERVNHFSYQLLMNGQIEKFAEGTLQDLDDLKVSVYPLPRHQFMSRLLTNKLELQMQDVLFEDGLIPSWCVYLVETCPFLLPFDTRWKYFCLTAHRSFMTDQINSSPNQVNSSPDQVSSHSDQVKSPPLAKKYRVTRSAILEGAVSMMTNHGPSSRIVEVEFEGEIGTGRGPTFEFYTTVSHELQRAGLGMWRGENSEDGLIHARFGLFPKPWSSSSAVLRGVDFSNVLQKFKLLGHLVARAVLDGRILDIPLSKAFYKVLLQQELDIYDIPSFDPELGKTLVEFQAVVRRKKFLERSSRTSNPSADLSYRNVKLEDLCLDFTLPGNPEYELVPRGSEKMVTLESLEEYVSLVVDATVKSGIAKQIEAFKSGIKEVLALKTLKMFTEEEMEHILCGEQDSWASVNFQDHIEFEHGFDMSSPSIITFLEVLREFGREEQRAFIQFTTGAPQLPLGGLGSLDPKLTVVRKQCDGNVDDELPSVNTCRHFIKLPPYSSKDIMKRKLKYAITEGLGSFHLS
ncbi:hypothetical protein U9M48_041696 [Paspalum notatum var. saurae]|uniref:HECT-type E3 ubiquitin transferase n=1 Tax=Paspalum notatum var. saurae TaxID=547442 RepID=A0AAQ3UNX7_PASNO